MVRNRCPNLPNSTRTSRQNLDRISRCILQKEPTQTNPISANIQSQTKLSSPSPSFRQRSLIRFPNGSIIQSIQRHDEASAQQPQRAVSVAGCRAVTTSGGEAKGQGSGPVRAGATDTRGRAFSLRCAASTRSKGSAWAWDTFHLDGELNP